MILFVILNCVIDFKAFFRMKARLAWTIFANERGLDWMSIVCPFVLSIANLALFHGWFFQLLEEMSTD